MKGKRKPSDKKKNEQRKHTAPTLERDKLLAAPRRP